MNDEFDNDNNDNDKVSLITNVCVLLFLLSVFASPSLLAQQGEGPVRSQRYDGQPAVRVGALRRARRRDDTRIRVARTLLRTRQRSAVRRRAQSHRAEPTGRHDEPRGGRGCDQATRRRPHAAHATDHSREHAQPLRRQGSACRVHGLHRRSRQEIQPRAARGRRAPDERRSHALSASGITPARLVASADSVSLCLSKGLAAPVGSVIVGSAPFILRAKRLRKALGGGMRQSGVLAAAGLLAVNEMVHGLKDDHRRVQTIAEAMRSIEGVIVPAAADVHTNILFVTIDALRIDCTASQLCVEFKHDNMLASAMGDRIRFVTHYMIDDAAMDKAIDIITRVITRHQKK